MRPRSSIGPVQASRCREMDTESHAALRSLTLQPPELLPQLGKPVRRRSSSLRPQGTRLPRPRDRISLLLPLERCVRRLAGQEFRRRKLIPKMSRKRSPRRCKASPARAGMDRVSELPAVFVTAASPARAGRATSGSLLKNLNAESR